MRTLAWLLLIAAWTGDLQGFNGERVTEGPLTVQIQTIAPVTNFDVPQQAIVLLTNSGPAPLQVRLETRDWVDECRAVGHARQALAVPAHGVADATFQFQIGRGAASALYPFHVYARFEAAGKAQEAHAIQIFETRFAPAGRKALDEPPLLQVPNRGALALASTKAYQVLWQRFGGTLKRLPVGWEGSEPESKADFRRGPVDRGGVRQALHTHPPYAGGAGTLFVEYRLRLPASTPIRLQFFTAIRDSFPPEPPSDGVTFRVWVDDRQLFSRHGAEKSWVPGEADLSAYAGREVCLRLESHPGPDKNTTCDLAYWGDPVIFAGPPPAKASAEERARFLDQARKAALAGAASPGAHVLELADGFRAAIVPGPNGVMDGAIAIGSSKGAVVFAGLRASISGQTVGLGPSGVVVRKVRVLEKSPDRLKIDHEIVVSAEGNSRESRLTVEFRAEGAGLRMRVASPEPLTDLALRETDLPAKRAYYGHGYCLVDPDRLRAGGGGHNLSASHVGFDFENGLSLLMACDTPPDSLEISRAQRLYTLHTHPDTTFTFVPGHAGAFECAFKYRALDQRRPAGAFTKKAGRFVCDYWGGRYTDDARLLERCFSYGATNALVIMHVWQRWGYDYRLPDIYPPNAGLGSLADLRQVGEVCDRAGALWGLHDNYIDFYPDADNYSYEHITFDENGQPRRAWLNEGRKAQSYQFRPDHVAPFLKRNLDLIEPALKPTASFVDVWTSISAFDYFDKSGKFHSKMETLRCWGEGFNQLRDKFRNGPTTSEAGSDQLIGWLDGADCQFLQLSPDGGRFRNAARCADWERVPWFDAVHHRRFSLHGVGYSDRYEGGLSRAEHGIESDDYIGAEILTGHALMIDLRAGARGAVRKYWLAQRFVESIADAEITGVTFAENDLHKLDIAWGTKARVLVNRGTNDWAVGGRVLPPYGFLAVAGDEQVSLERIAGTVVEQSRGRDYRYVNARGANTAVDFGGLKTTGAFRVSQHDKELIIHPLPGEAAFAIQFDLEKLYGPGRRATRAVVLNEQGQPVGQAALERSDTGWRLEIKAGEFGYRIELTKVAQ